MAPQVPKFETLLLQASPSNANTQTVVASDGAPDPVASQLAILREFAIPKDVFGKISRYEAHLWREVHKILQSLGPAPARRGRFGSTQARMNEERLAKQRDETHAAILRDMNEPRALYR